MNKQQLVTLINMNCKSVKNMAEIKANVTHIKLLKNFLTLVNNYTENPLYLFGKITENSIEVPRGLVKKQAIDNEKWEKISIQSKINLRDYQEKAVDAYFKHIQDYNGGILSLETGAGKTIIAIDIMSKLKGTTLIVVPTQYLLQQWVDRLLENTDLTKNDIGIIQGQNCIYKDKKVVIAMIHSLAQKTYEKDVYSYFYFTIFDEVHTLSATTFSETAKQFWTKYRLGLSATPRRKDGTDAVFLYHIGDICYRYSTSKSFSSVYFIEYKDKETIGDDCYIYNGDFNLGKYINKIASNDKRNQVIIRLIKACLNKNRKVLVLSDRKEQLQFLQSVFPKQSGLFISQIKETDKPVLLGTYGSAGLGVDLPDLDTLILATPRADIEQAVGRIFRKQVYDKQPIIFDIVDSLSRKMLLWQKKRMKFYESRNFSINTLNLTK